MCLEFLNQFLLPGLTWLALAAFAGLIAVVAIVSLLTSSDKSTKERSAKGFTCPCYAPPLIHPDNEAK